MTRRRQRSKFVEWGQGLPSWLTALAYIVPKAAESIYEVCRMARREDGSITLSRGFPLDVWRSYYSDLGALFQEVSHLLAGEGQEHVEEIVNRTSDELKGAYEDWRNGLVIRLGALYADPETRQWAMDELSDEFAKVIYFSDDRLTNIVLIVIDRFFTFEMEEEEGQQFIESPAIRFVLEVLVPCIVQHQELPSTLFSRAIDGDWDALEKLIELDRWVLMFADWAAMSYTGDSARDQEFRELQAKALTRQRPKLDIGELKITLAAMLSYLGHACGIAIAHKKLRERFDLHAQSSGQGERDRDLPVSDDTFGRVIRRHRTDWESYTPHLPQELIDAVQRIRKQKASKQGESTAKKAA